MSRAGGWAREHARAALRVRTHEQHIESKGSVSPRIKTQHAYELRL